ncbi:PiggyBac transposable element-derived protein 3 [Eumeta japonica]|uniref:PiggyBac transposable element-derived protein 3 n=1 Tax=Eumeta variegata TaxID=151549 RepID=A0A4C1TBA1_EUMVA|nr:PiggyBac transposable element-derived protein 3 [Eumeta japonica]
MENKIRVVISELAKKKLKLTGNVKRKKDQQNLFAATGEGPSENRGGDRKYHDFRSKRESVQKFIMNFQPLESHYCRGKVKRRIYLDLSLNILKLYKIYEDQVSPGYSVTKSFFRKVFNTSFNIGFGSPRQDVCSDCLQLIERLKIEKSEIEKQKLRTQYRIHKLRAECFFDILKQDDPETLVLSFDCQKNLPLAKVADQSAYYSRQLYIHNFTIVEGNSHVPLTKDNVYSYVWTEDQASKGANEVSSCLYHCLNQLSVDGKTLIKLIADGCGGQNKNTILLGMVAKWLHGTQHTNIKQVEIVFPVTGHSFLPPDRVFALTEKKIRRLETITNPQTYIDVMASNATIHRLVDEVPIFDWKSACKGVLKSTQTLHFQINNLEEEEEVEVPAPKKKKKKENTIKKWYNNVSNTCFTTCGKGDCDEEVFSNSQEEMTAVECFELLYSDDIVKFIADMSNLYALQRNHTLNVTSNEIRVYIAILLLTGYLTQNSTSLPANDKFAKVREYFTKLNVNFTANFTKAGSSHISIDETIVPYFGRHGTKQHIHGKPIRFGYKLWSAATRHGYLVNFEPYQGASGPSLKMQSELGLGAAVILELHSRLPIELGPYNLYFDNFFTGLPMLKYLREQNVGGTGTVRENRLENCNLPNSKDMKKSQEASYIIRLLKNLLQLNGMIIVSSL